MDYKELKNEFLEMKASLEKDYRREKVLKYWKGETDFVVKFDNKYFFTVPKQNIKKDFCFGHGYCGVTTEEEQNGAFAMQSKAENDKSYFLKENLQVINEYITEIECWLQADNSIYNFQRLLEEKKLNWRYMGKPCIYQKYYNENDLHVGLTFYKEKENDHNNLKQYLIRELTKEEMEILLNAFKAEKEKFVKRLNTYLKKYGLSKIHAWTYLVD